ncbi:MAG: STAS domain-containing protein, partial [Planctomycetes bacterium]|nr:STAS domain-containing protein [Planctomycetota bacterium]
MKIEFAEIDAILVSRPAGAYTSAPAYNEVSRILLGELEESPRRTIIDLEGIVAIDAGGLGAMETLCWRIAKNLGQEIRLANPSPAVQTQVKATEMTVPIHPTVEAARASFEPEDLGEDLFEPPVEQATEVEVVWTTPRPVRGREVEAVSALHADPPAPASRVGPPAPAAVAAPAPGDLPSWLRAPVAEAAPQAASRGFFLRLRTEFMDGLPPLAYLPPPPRVEGPRPEVPPPPEPGEPRELEIPAEASPEPIAAVPPPLP